MVVLRTLAGLLGGVLAGVVLTLGIVVARARLQSVFLHELGEVIGWTGLGLLAGPAVGLWLALSGGRLLAPTAGGALAGLVGGAGIGVLAGSLGSADPAWAWAGGVMGAASGMLLGALAGLVRTRRNSPSGEVGGTPVLALLAAFALGAGACGEASEEPLPPPGGFEEPGPEEVEAVVFLLGDPGEARADRYPILPRVRAEVERWAGSLDADSAVVVVVLGDLVYPDGVAPRASPGFAEDSARVADQVGLVAGPRAVSRHARLHLLPGNHDWGTTPEASGVERLERLAGILGGFRERGAVSAFLDPPPGTGGPTVVDLGDRVRLLLLDTAWWLLEPDPAERDRVVDGIRRAMRSAGDRRVVIAAHHPFESAGPHGVLETFGRTVGIRTLLSRSGALLQNLHSRPYRELRRALRAVFAEEGRPVLFAGGHEHSLQVVRGEGDDVPRVSLVSGSASKLTPVGTTPGLAFARSAPGYARLFVMRDGSLELRLDAAPARYLRCPGEGPERSGCMEEGVAAYRTVWTGGLGPD